MGGLDNSGKTALCHFLSRRRRGWPALQPRPEHHVLHHDVTLDGRNFRFVDPCGGNSGRQGICPGLWEELLGSRPDGIVFMVDASDSARHGQAREALHRVLQHKSIGEIPVLVLGSKIDLRTARTPGKCSAAWGSRALATNSDKLY